MTKLDYETAKARHRGRAIRKDHPIGPAVRPVTSGKRYETYRQASNAARYVNQWGRQRQLYEWFVEPASDGQGFELWRRPRPQPKL